MRWCVILVCVVSGCRQSPVEDGPAVEVRPTRRYLGEALPGKKVAGQFQLRNVGSERLEVRSIVSYCGCGSVRPNEPFTIEPNDSKILEVELELGEREWNSGARFAAETNDPRNPVVFFLATASRARPLLASPNTIDFGSVAVGSSVSATVLLLRPNGSSISEAELRSLQLSSSCDWLRPLAEYHNGEARITLSIDVATLKGPFDAQVRIDGVDIRESVHVYGIVRSDVFAVPSSIVLPRSRECPFEASLVVMSKAEGSLGQLVQTQLPDGVELAVGDADHDNPLVMRFAVVVHPEFVQNDASMQLSFSGCSVPISIPLVLRPAE